MGDIYLQNLPEDIHGIKKFYTKIACKECGLIPEIDLGKVTNNGVDMTIKTKGWEVNKEEIKCRKCNRKSKNK